VPIPPETVSSGRKLGTNDQLTRTSVLRWEVKALRRILTMPVQSSQRHSVMPSFSPFSLQQHCEDGTTALTICLSTLS
jgi:hypothetical protein